MRQRALATVHAVAHVGEAGLLTAFTQVSLAESPGCALPESRPELLPGSGGRAAQAGANIPAVGDYTSRVLGHGALPPWHMPAQPSGDPRVALAPKGGLLLCD
jgi:hypothetical protein